MAKKIYSVEISGVVIDKDGVDTVSHAEDATHFGVYLRTANGAKHIHDFKDPQDAADMAESLAEALGLEVDLRLEGFEEILR